MLPSRRVVLVVASCLAAYPTARAGLTDLSRVKMVEGGNGWGLALMEDGTVLAWGDNFIGQLGDGTTEARFLPVPVKNLGPDANVIAISAGNYHAMALKADGTVVAWGDNLFGQVGDGTTFAKLEPTQVIGLGPGSQVVQISAGFNHSFARRADGTVLCWGRGSFGNCGTGSFASPLTAPVQTLLPSGRRAKGVNAGGNSTIALLDDDTVWTWGNNPNGQLGIGPAPMQGLPVHVTALTDMVEIATSRTGSCYARRRDGAVFAWGQNSSGQLGDGTSQSRNTPVQVLAANSSVTALAPGNAHVLALRADGTVLAWGSNLSGQLGAAAVTPGSLSPIPIPAFAPNTVSKIAAGGTHSYAIGTDGKLLAWGDNGFGQLGIGTFSGELAPVQALGLGPGSTVTAISAGPFYSLAVKDSGTTLLAWGLNSSGQHGNGLITGSTTPVSVQLPARVTAVSAGTTHALALTETGQVLAWGANNVGQLGNGTTTPSRVPIAVPGIDGVVIEVVAAANRSFALMNDGTVLVWGGGSLGLGPANESRNPVPVPALSGIVALAASGLATYALKNDGAVLAWGTNVIAQLGTGTLESTRTPVQVAGLGPGSTVRAIGAYNLGGYAIKADGTILGWGGNDTGEIGDGTTAMRLSPVVASAVRPTSPVKTLMGGLHALLLGEDGSVLAWGANGVGQLGDGTGLQRLAPVQVSGLGVGSGAIMISTSAVAGNHSLALLQNGTVLAWGSNGSGELGTGVTYPENRTPSNVLFDDVTAPVTVAETRDLDGDGLADRVTLAATDAASGVQEIRYTVNGVPGVFEGAQGEIDLSSPAATATITFFAIDRVGNVENPKLVSEAIDACPTAAGASSHRGCPYASQYDVVLHAIDLGGGSTTSALPGVEVRVLDRADPGFLAAAGGGSPSGTRYPELFAEAPGLVGSCVTGVDGRCVAGIAKVGEEFAIARFFDPATGATVYVGLNGSPDEYADTDGDGKGDLAARSMQLVKVTRGGVFVEYRGGNKMCVIGA
jgi:alpha-tubulin suppressor-like RCC1 family protein